MKYLFVLLSIALISVYTIKPKSKSNIWISAILIPFISMIIYGLVASGMRLGYYAGQEMGKALPAAIISGVFIFFLLRRKFKNDNKIKFPILLVSLIGLSLIISIFQQSLEVKNRKAIQRYAESKGLIDFDSYSSQLEASGKLINVYFNGVSFSCPESWQIDKIVLEDKPSLQSFQIKCEKKNLNYFIINWYRHTLSLQPDPDKFIDSFIEGYEDYKFKKIKTSNFKNVSCRTVEYNFNLKQKKFFGKVISFILNGNTVFIMKQSDSKIKLNSEFKIMEESFEIF